MKLIFSQRAWEQYLHWQEADAVVLARLNGFIQESRRTPFKGLGHPEPLKGELRGFWSRRLTQEHRFVYRVLGKGDEQALEIAQCRFHY